MAKCLGPSDDEDCPHNLRGGGEDGRCLDCGDKYYLFANHPTEYEKCPGPFPHQDCPDGNDAIPSGLGQQIGWDVCASCEEYREQKLREQTERNQAPPLRSTTLPESYYNKYGGYDWNNKDA